MRRTTKAFLACLLALVILLCACSGGGGTSDSQGGGSSTPAKTPQEEFTGTPYQAPPFQTAEFHQDKAEQQGDAYIDISAVNEGYVAVSAISENRLKFQVIKGETTYTYDMASDGTPSIFPIQSGNGSYLFRIMENVSEKKYGEMFSVTGDVTLIDDFQPFIRPSSYVNYTQDSACVKKAAELAQTASTALDVVSNVYEFVCATVTYDDEKAATVKSGYLPDPDLIMSSGMGICFDYAALSAAMLRSQGIPCKMIFGYVSPNDVYHAWNMFYTEETGWVTVSFEVKEDSWNRMDLTFSANGADDTFIGDGNNYTDLYFY